MIIITRMSWYSVTKAMENQSSVPPSVYDHVCDDSELLTMVNGSDEYQCVQISEYLTSPHLYHGISFRRGINGFIEYGFLVTVKLEQSMHDRDDPQHMMTDALCKRVNELEKENAELHKKVFASQNKP